MQVLYSVPDAAQQLGVGTRTMWQLIHDGKVTTKRIGRRSLVAHEELERYAAELES